MVFTLCVSQHVCQCVKRESDFLFSVGRFSSVICRAVFMGCGLKLAIRAKSSTNPVGKGLGLRFQRGDLEEKHQLKFHSNMRVASVGTM